MNKNKNIDQLFKDRFKNFEASPSPQVWENIQAKLKEKEDRKVIPLWLKLGGVAAILVLMLTVGNSIFNPSLTNNAPSITEENTDIKTQEPENNTITNDPEIEKTVVVSENKNSNKDAFKNSSDDSNNKIDKNIPESEIAYENDNISDKTKNIIKDSEDKISNASDAVAKNEVNNIDDADNDSLIKKENVLEVTNDKEAVAEVKTTDNKNITSEIEKTYAEIAALVEQNKRSIYDAIEETDNKEAVAVVNNKPDNRWEITPNAGPVYYNSLSEGSSIDPSFSDNPKSGDLNITYGVQVSYNLNHRLSVRSGLSNVNLSYSTTGIELGNGPVAVALKSVDYSKRSDVLIAVDRGALADLNPEGEFGNIVPKSTSGEPSINQNISYYEIPLELKYALLNKKIGVNLIGGFSTLLLGNNEVFVEAGDFNEILGEANNLSTMSFTTNIGLGLNYSFSKKLMFNIEPMFKYQLNPYTDSSVDFKPYYVGIYSGLSFKF